MKLWKKRWFVLSDMCLFYYRGEDTQTHMHLFTLALQEKLKACQPCLPFTPVYKYQVVEDIHRLHMRPLFLNGIFA